MHNIQILMRKGWNIMEDRTGFHTSARDREILAILMDSGMYFDLPLEERCRLLKHVSKQVHSTLAEKSNPGSYSNNITGKNANDKAF